MSVCLSVHMSSDQALGKFEKCVQYVKRVLKGRKEKKRRRRKIVAIRSRHKLDDKPELIF